MGFRVKKSVKLGKGVKLNLNKKSAGISFGGKGHRATINSKGRMTGTLGIPGTGVSYSKSIGGKKGRKRSSGSNSRQQYAYEDSGSFGEFLEMVLGECSPKTYRICGIILQVISPILFVLSLLLALVFPLALLVSAFAVFLFFMGRKYRRMAKEKESEQAVAANDEQTTDK